MENKPLSCHLGTHFTRKEGLKDVCMYCHKQIVDIVWNTLDNGQRVWSFKPESDIAQEFSDSISKKFAEDMLSSPKEVLLRNAEVPFITREMSDGTKFTFRPNHFFDE